MRTRLRNLHWHISRVPQLSMTALRNAADKLGICLSALCVVHCLSTPIVILLLPALRMSRYHEGFHQTLLLVLPLLAFGAFIPGYRKHRDLQVFLWSIPGLVLLAIGAFVFEDHDLEQVTLSVAGSLLLIRAHWVNRRLCSCCESGHSAHKPVKTLAQDASSL